MKKIITIISVLVFLGLSNQQVVIANTITTSALSSSWYCAAGSISVPYTITGTYTSGNQFKAQLSDSSGSFASPTLIGLLTSTSAGTISATLSIAQIQGIHYRIRVISTTPAVTGSDNGSNITIYRIISTPPTHWNFTNVTCYGLNNGEINTSITGATPPYTYVWSPGGSTTATISNLSPGTYHVTFTDANGCHNMMAATITQPASALSANMAAHTNENCYGGNTASLTASGSGGTSAYSYLWSNAATTATISGLVVGTYVVTVTDANGCTATNTATITQPTAVTATISDTIIYSVGIAVVTASGGTSGYTYLWSPMGQTTNTIVTSEFGGNSVVVTDSHGCTVTLSQAINLPDTETNLGNTAFYTNFGQIKDTRDSVSTAVKFYTVHNYPANYFLQDTISYVFSKTDTSSSHHDTLQRVSMSFYRGNTSNPMVIDKQTTAYLNYYLPQCSSGKTNIYGYNYVLYPEVYNHIEALFNGNSDGLKYYILIMPGADTSQIMLQYDGADSASALSDGTMEIYSHYGTVKQAVPQVYQVDSSGNRVAITWAASYYSAGTNQIKFHLGAYNTNLPLVLQIEREHHAPAEMTNIGNLNWSSYIGGISSELYSSTITDNSGNCFMIGQTYSTDFPIHNGTQEPFSAGGQVCVLVKFNPVGNTVTHTNIEWSTYYGSDDDDVPLGIAINNNNGNIYMVGCTDGNSFPVETSLAGGNFNYTSNVTPGYQDAFILRFNTSGYCTWASCIGGSADQFAYGVAVNQNTNDVYVVGGTNSSTGATIPFPLHSSANSNSYNQNVSAVDYDGFIMRFNQYDSIKWSTYFGGNGEDYLTCVTVLSNNDVVIAGNTISSNPNVPVTSGTFQLANNAGELQLCDAGSGAYYDTTYNLNSGSGDHDIILLSFNSSDQLIWGTYFGGSADDNVPFTNRISGTNPASLKFYIIGTTNSADLPVTAPSLTHYQQDTFGGGFSDAFVARFNNFKQEWTTYFGGDGRDIGYGIAVDASNHCFIGGFTLSGTPSTNACGVPLTIGQFPVCNTSGGYYTRAFGGNQTAEICDGFIAKFDSTDNLLWSTYMGAAYGYIRSLSTYQSQYLYFTGDASDGVDSFSFPQLYYTNLYWQFDTLGSPLYSDINIGRFFISPSEAGGIKEILKDSKGELVVYPNPSSDIFTLLLKLPAINNNGVIKIKVFDCYGREIIEKELTINDDILQTSLNMTNFADGIYMIQVVTDLRNYLSKIIKN